MNAIIEHLTEFFFSETMNLSEPKKYLSPLKL